MTDKELLELAAKAAGYDVVWNPLWQCFQHKNPIPDKYGTFRHPWIPLDDDGDALRLAVKLGIQIHQEGSDDGVAVWADQVMLWADGNALAATRRAIVRAAADIGKNKEL